MNWKVGYRVGNTYKSKVVIGKTANKAIQRARVKDIQYLYRYMEKPIADTNSILCVCFDGDFTEEKMAHITHIIGNEIPHKKVYFNDLDCRYWTFDFKIQDGRNTYWVQNISFTDSLHKVHCLIQKEI